MESRKPAKKRKKMGRPPLPPAERRDALVTMRLTEAEREELERDAAKAGLSLSAYLVKCWLEKRSE